MELKKAVCPGCGSDNLKSDATREDITCPNCGGVFPKKPELKVFFSYGHDDHAPFVSALADAVEKRSGYAIDVWIDHVKLREGSEWRSEIEKSIKNSNSVLAFLSKYSARERGVCLDELAIAISSKYGMIRSVLLEKLNKDGNFEPVEDKPLAPPAMASAYQWADMSDYKEHKDNKDDFENYVNEKADKIIEMLSGDEIKKYNSDLTFLRSKLNLPQPQQRDWKFEYMLNQEHYVGREWLKEKVDAWLADENGKRILLLYGKPGSGKSMFAAHLQYYNSAVAAAFACEYNSDEFSNTDNIVSWLAYKLAMRIPSFRENLLRQFEEGSFDPGKGKDRFNSLILSPLADSIDGDHAKMMIVIDAIDEVKTGELKEFVKWSERLFPRWLKIFVTARPEPGIKQCFEEYPSVDYEDYKLANNADLKAYFKERLSAALAGREGIDEFYSRLVEASEGVFAYAEKVCDNIIDDLKEDPGKKLGDYPLPKGLHGLFKDTLDRKKFERFDDESEKDLDFVHFWRVPLSMVIASPEPLPVETLKRLMGWGDEEYKDFRAPLSTMLTDENGCVAAFHRSFAEWLETPGAEGYGVSRKDGFRRLAKKSYELYQKGVDKLDEFALTHLTSLLREAGMTDEYACVAGDDKFFHRLFALESSYIRHSLFAEAIAIDKEIIEATQNQSTRHCMSICAEACNRSGYAFERVGDYTRAASAFAGEIAIRKKLAEELSNDLELKRELAKSLTRLINLHIEKCEYDKALELCDEEIAINEHIVKSYNSGHEFDIDTVEFKKKEGEKRRDYMQLSSSLAIAAEAYEKKKDYTNAIKLNEKALKIRERLVAGNQSLDDYFGAQGFKKDARFRKPLEDLLRKLGELYRIIGDEAKAEMHMNRANEVYDSYVCRSDSGYARKCCEEQLQILRQGLADNPNSLRRKELLAKSLNEYAAVLDACCASAEADKVRKEEISIRKQLIEENPSVFRYKTDLAEIYRQGLRNGCFNSSQVLPKWERASVGWETDELRDIYEDAVRIHRQIAEERPQEREFKFELAFVLRLIASKYSSANRRVPKDVTKAAELYDEALDIERQLVTEYPQEIVYKSRLIYDLDEAAKKREETGDSAGALELYDEALGIRRLLVRDYPQELQYKKDLIDAIENAANKYHKNGGSASALGLYEEELELKRQLVADYPKDNDYKRELASTLLSVASGKVKTNEDNAGMVSCCQEAISIITKLMDEFPKAPVLAEDLAAIYYFLTIKTDNPDYRARALEAARRFPDAPVCKRIIEKLG